MIRYDRIQQAFFEAFTGVADHVSWSYGESPKDSGDLLSLTLTGGPSHHNRDHVHGLILCPADSLTIHVSAATVGTRPIIRLNDHDYFTDVVGGDTPETVRDRLLAKIQAGEPVAALSAAANGTDRIDLAAAFLGGLRKLTFPGQQNELLPEVVVFSGDAVLVTEGTMAHTLLIEAFSPGREPRNGAWAMITDALERLTQLSVVAQLHAFGVVLWGKGTPINLSAIAGANWESRALVDVEIAARTIAIEPVEQIETVNAIVAIASDTFTATAVQP